MGTVLVVLFVVVLAGVLIWSLRGGSETKGKAGDSSRYTGGDHPGGF